LEWNDRALVAKNSGDAHMELNRTLINMTYGKWPDWWVHYERCLSYQKNEKMRGMSMSDAWSGEECPGKTLLVVSDQGAGDAIQFSRYLREAKALGKFGKLTYLVQPDLKDLLRRVDGVDEVIGFGEKSGTDFQSFSSLLGVMRVLKVSPANAARAPHIVTDPKLNELWKYRVESESKENVLRVALVWAGDPRHGNDHARSFSLAQFLSHANLPMDGVQFFSFQMGAAAKQLEAEAVDESREIVDLAQNFRSYDDTASALCLMDALVTCDTSVAHLAGCLGVPTKLIIANPPEWRWLTEGGKSPWYGDSFKVYRQRTPKDWSDPMRAVVSDLLERKNLCKWS
jgi:hypothetical protein